MFADVCNLLAECFTRLESRRNAPARGRRVDRRYTFSGGLEGLEGRLAPSGGVAPVTVTVTNQTDTSTQTDTTDETDTSNQTASNVQTSSPMATPQPQMAC